jgi:hypothetical protein
MARKTYNRVERAIIGLMMIGMLGMFQPFLLALYRYGFLLLLFSTLLFIVISHMTPKPESLDAGGPVSLEQAVEHMQGHER